MPKLYIEEFVGITNRLETLPLAFAIQQEFGHKIVLDWRELDSFSVDGTSKGKVTWLTKLGAVRVRNCDETAFANLRGKKILLRSLDGPDDRLNRIYMEIPRKLHLKHELAAAIRGTFTAVNGRPVVGIHIRRGDFQVIDPDVYRIEGYQWPAVPLWWYERTMERLIRLNPEICFFLSCTGDPSNYPSLVRNFDVITLPVESHYGYKNSGSEHFSTVNPVADLFALACCPVVLATPVSGYSHWAANVLGVEATCLVPMPGATPESPQTGKVNIFGSRLPRWRSAGRTGSDTLQLDIDLAGLDLVRPAETGWL